MGGARRVGERFEVVCLEVVARGHDASTEKEKAVQGKQQAMIDTITTPL